MKLDKLSTVIGGIIGLGSMWYGLWTTQNKWPDIRLILVLISLGVLVVFLNLLLTSQRPFRHRIKPEKKSRQAIADEK